jgi:hypothetical protein
MGAEQTGQRRRFPMPDADTKADQATKAAVERVVDRMISPQVPVLDLQDALLPDDTLNRLDDLPTPQAESVASLPTFGTIIDTEITPPDPVTRDLAENTDVTLNATQLSGEHHNRKRRKEHPRMKSARDFIAEQDQVSTEGTLEEGTETTLRPKSHINGLIDILAPKDFNDTGAMLTERLKNGPVQIEEILAESDNRPQQIPDLVMQRLIEGFIETGYVRLNADKLSLTPKGRKSMGYIGYDAVKSTLIATDALRTQHSRSEVKKIADVHRDHDVDANTQVVEINEHIDRPSAKVLYLSDILVGNNASDTRALLETIDDIKRLPQEERPDVIVVSGIMEGGHKFRNKAARIASVQGLDGQYASAKIIFDKIQDLGSKVVYVMGANDRAIAHDGTVEAMRTVRNLAAPLTDSQKGDVTYWQQDAYMQDAAWDQNLKFQLEVVFPYCLRSGRRLRSADEVAKITKGKIRIEEYLLLWDAYQSLIGSQNIPDVYKKVLKIENIHLPGVKNSGLEITDGVNLNLDYVGGKTVTAVRDRLKFGSAPMYGNSMDAALALFRQHTSQPNPKPLDVLAVTGHDEGVGTVLREGVVVTLPGFLDSRRVLNQKGAIAQSGQGRAYRGVTTRRREMTPGAMGIESTADGITRFTFHNSALREKADSVDRTFIAQIADLQTGSITSQPDKFIKFLDMLTTRYADQGKIIIVANGDLVHGRNYKGMDMECAATGLMRVPDQIELVDQLINRAYGHIPQEDLRKMIERVGIVAGNHEWNSSYDRTGDAFVRDFEMIFRTLLGVGKFDPRVIPSERILTQDGDFFQAWTLMQKIGEYGMLAQHMPMMKGGKGSGTRIALTQVQALIESMGRSARNVDLVLTGHYHNGSIYQDGDRVYSGSPSFAGESGFEHMLGFKAVPGGMVVGVGGDRPVQVDILSKKTLDDHVIRNGYFSAGDLSNLGIKSDKNYNPLTDNIVLPTGQINKAIYAMTRGIITQHTKFI